MSDLADVFSSAIVGPNGPVAVTPEMLANSMNQPRPGQLVPMAPPMSYRDRMMRYGRQSPNVQMAPQMTIEDLIRGADQWIR